MTVKRYRAIAFTELFPQTLRLKDLAGYYVKHHPSSVSTNTRA
jgi:hypothetical protein